MPGLGKINCNRYSLLRKHQRLYFFWVVIEYQFSLLFILQKKQICDFDSFSSNFLSTSVKLYRQ